jgi:hypothetical protein
MDIDAFHPVRFGLFETLYQSRKGFVKHAKARSVYVHEGQ